MTSQRSPLLSGQALQSPSLGVCPQFRLAGTGGLQQQDGVLHAQSVLGHLLLPPQPVRALLACLVQAGGRDPFPFLLYSAEPSLTPAANLLGCWPCVPGFSDAASEFPRCSLSREQSCLGWAVTTGSRLLPRACSALEVKQTAPWGPASCRAVC